MPDNKANFTQQLLQWNHTQNHRFLPWKGIDNAYFIWLSEIILQQTRVEQGLPYYLQFTQKYPTVVDLAQAPEDEIMKMWEGLGYYSRARNLHAAAKFVCSNFGGEFPKTYQQIRELKGVGDYTAAAVASFAYNLPYAVVDGNVYRVLARYFGIETPIDSTQGKKQFAQLAQELLPPKQANIYNQAIIDFGAKHCTPAKPLCMLCNLQSECVAFQTGKTADLPIKSKKIIKKTRYFYYLIIQTADNRFFVRKRIEKDIWQNLYEFFLIETPQILNEQETYAHINRVIHISDAKIAYFEPTTQLLTHQKIISQFVHIHLPNNTGTTTALTQYELIDKKTLKKLAFPKSLKEFIQKLKNIF